MAAGYAAANKKDNQMKKNVDITVQHTTQTDMYRITKLVNAVVIYTGNTPRIIGALLSAMQVECLIRTYNKVTVLPRG
jgi:hypothetical protein